MSILSHEQLLELQAAVITVGLTKSRNALLAGIDAAFVAGLSDEGAPGTLIATDLDAMNMAGALSDGNVPLLRWLQNAVALTRPRQEAAIFGRALEQVRERTRGAMAQTLKTAIQSTTASQFSTNIQGSTIGSFAAGDYARAVGSAYIPARSSSSSPGAGTLHATSSAMSQGSDSKHQAIDAPIDFAILTAIEVERRAVCTALGLTDKDRVKRHGRVYWRGKLPINNGAAYNIVIAQPAEMGQVEATALATEVAHIWRPRAALMVGIAASTKPDEVKLGDIVVGRSVYYYEHGKVTADGTKPQPEMIPADAGLLKHYAGLADWDGTVLAPRPDGTSAVPRVSQGVIASGDKVVAHDAARDAIAAGQRKILALEMEGYGFSRALWLDSGRVRHLVIRGISDDGSKHKTDDWHKYAAASAAGFAKHFLLDGPLEQDGSRTTAPLSSLAAELGTHPSQSSDASMREGKHTHVEQITAAFAIEYANRESARAAIEPVLAENRTIFNEYGPDNDYKYDPESELAPVWQRKVLSHILPNNRKILSILDRNRRLLRDNELITLEQFRQHVDDLEVRHLGDGVTAVGRRFPTEISDILKDNGDV